MTSAPSRRPPNDRVTRYLGWGIGVVLIGALSVLSALQLPGTTAGSRMVSGVTAFLFCGLAASCWVLWRRARREQAQAEAERRLARASVEELTTARLRAEQSDAINRELIQLLGREMRGPLASIRGFARELEERSSQLSPDQRAEFFAVIRRQSHRLVRVIEDLMLAARLAGGDPAPDALVPVDVAAELQEAVQEVLAPPSHRIVVSVANDLPQVRSDSSELRQVILALVENAIRFSPGGGTVEVAAVASGGSVEISVRDEGIGVPSHLRERIFELLAVGDSGSHDSKGLGIGLFLAQAVAARCDGEVRLEPNPDRGSTFTLRLPALVSKDEPSLLTADVGIDRIETS